MILVSFALLKLLSGDCRVERHQHTRIYGTVGRVRKCNACGATPKVIGPFADELREYAMQVADRLRASTRIEAGDGPVIMIEEKLAVKIEKKLRTLAMT